MSTTRRAFSVAIFVRHEGRVLLIHHKRLDTWLPVGGEIEPGETPLEAARRELREETGLEGRFQTIHGVDGTPPGLIGYEEHLAGDKGLHMNFVFVADVDTDVITPCDEFLAHRWVTHAEDVACPANVRELVRIARAAGGEMLEALATMWLEAFNKRELDRLLSFYAEDAIHSSPKLRVKDPSTNGLVRGKPALRAWWSDSMTRLPGLYYRPLHITAHAREDGGRVFMEYMRENPGEASYVVAEVLVVKAGLIRESHVFHG